MTDASEPRTVLVTGAAGAIGREVLDRLDAAGVETITTDRVDADRPGHVVLDLADRMAVDGAIGGLDVDVVIHLAGALHGSVEDLFVANVVGTTHLLDAIGSGTSVVVAGSAAEYGAGDGRTLGEAATLAPVNAYGWSKAAQTATAGSLASRRGLPLTVLRPFNVVSSSLPPTTALGNARRQIAGAGSGTEVRIVAGRVDILRDYVPLSFVADAFVAAALDPEPGGVFNVCSGVGVELGAVLVEMAALRGVELTIEPDPDLVALPAAERVVGDASALDERYGLTVEATPRTVASWVWGTATS